MKTELLINRLVKISSKIKTSQQKSKQSISLRKY